MTRRKDAAFAMLAGAILSAGWMAAARAQERQAIEQVLPVSITLCADMKARRVLNPGAPVGCDRLRLVRFRYVDFDGKEHDDGEIVVMDAAADHVLAIFSALHEKRFPIASAKLMNEFGGDDNASMDANNTSALNVRPVAGSKSISVHAYGLAIDLNTVQNPFIQRRGRNAGVSPKAGASYVDRGKQRPGMAEPVVDLFAEHGFVVWGGEWGDPDYQHFQVSRAFADRLARASAADARALFERYVARYRDCARGKDTTVRRRCARENG